MHMIFKSGSTIHFGWPKAIYCSKKEEFVTLSCNFKGLLSATELEQISKETLDYNIWHI